MGAFEPHVAKMRRQPRRTRNRSGSRLGRRMLSLAGGVSYYAVVAPGTEQAETSVAELSVDLDLGPDVTVVPRFRLVPGVLIPTTRYRMCRWIGEGGMGVIYEAEHVDLGRHSAIKILHGEDEVDAEKFETFRNEARAATQVGSPYIVDVLDFAELPDGRPLIIMEMLRGQTLDMELEIGPMPAERLVPMLRQVCKGLAAAHDAGIIHRDIKPDNIFALDPDPKQRAGRKDRVKILDFGVAGMIGREQWVGGSPHYMAPEQILGKSLEPHSDVYSLACSAYELICQSPPFRGTEVVAILHAHLEDSVPKISNVVAPGVCPEPLERVIMRGLAKDPADRYADMREFEAALCEAQIEAGIHTVWDDLPPPAVEEERQAAIETAMRASQVQVGGNRRWYLPVIGALLAVVLALGWAMARRSEEAVVVPGEVDTLAQQAQLAAARALFVYPPPKDPNAVTAYEKVVELELLDDDLEEAGRARAAELRQEFAATLTYLGDHYWDRQGGRPFAIDYYAQALLFDERHERAMERGALTPGQLADLRRKAGEDDFSPAELEAAEPLAVMAEEDVDARSERLGVLLEQREDRGLTADVRLGGLLEKLGEKPVRRSRTPPKPKAAQKPVEPAPLEADAENPDEVSEVPLAGPPVTGRSSTRDPKRARALVEEAERALRRGRRRAAEKLFDKALAADRKNAAAHAGLADIHFRRSNYAQAIPHAKAAVQAAPRNAEYRILLGDTYYRVLRYTEAQVQYERAKSLGHGSAARRLQNIAGRIGADPKAEG